MKEKGCLTKSQCEKIRRKAKKMGVETALNTCGKFNNVYFKYLNVWFKFNPFDFNIFIFPRSFFDKENLGEAKKEMDLAMEFKEFLEKINKEIEKESKK